MQRFIFAAIALFVLVSVAAGQMLKPIVGGGYSAGGGGGFTGIGDTLSGAKAHWGTIAYSAATRGQAMFSLCDVAGANCSDASSDATTGIVSSTQTRVNPCGSTLGVDACRIHTLYDDSGANYCTGAAVCPMGATPADLYFIPNVVGTVPGIKCNGTSYYAIGGTFPIVSQPLSWLASVRVDTSPGGGNYNGLIDAGTTLGGGQTMGFSNATIDAVYNAGSTITAPPAVSAGTFYAMIGTQPASGGTGTVSINGSTTTGTVGTAGNDTGVVRLCNDAGGIFPIQATFTEIGFYAADASGSVAGLTTTLRAKGPY